MKDKFGPDIVILDTDLPPSTFPYDETPFVTFKVAAKRGEIYVQENFPNIPYTMINLV